jgi:hypothetical protein
MVNKAMDFVVFDRAKEHFGKLFEIQMNRIERANNPKLESTWESYVKA